MTTPPGDSRPGRLPFLRGRLTFANLTALLALFVALGGTSYAALQLPRNSVGAKQIRQNSITSPKVKRGSLLTSDFRASQRARLRGPQGPQGPQGQQGPKGDRGDNVLAYAHINTDGTFDPTRSKDVLASTAVGNFYCVDFAGFDFPSASAKIVQTTLTTQGASDPGEIVAGVNGCSAGSVPDGDVFVYTYSSAGAAAAQAFDALIVKP